MVIKWYGAKQRGIGSILLSSVMTPRALLFLRPHQKKNRSHRYIFDVCNNSGKVGLKENQTPPHHPPHKQLCF